MMNGQFAKNNGKMAWEDKSQISAEKHINFHPIGTRHHSLEYFESKNQQTKFTPKTHETMRFVDKT